MLAVGYDRLALRNSASKEDRPQNRDQGGEGNQNHAMVLLGFTNLT